MRLIVVIILAVAMAGCSVGHKAVSESRDRVRSVLTDTSRLDSALCTVAGHVDLADTAAVCATERGRVEISRDSAGRPLAISWSYEGAAASVTRRAARATLDRASVSATRHTAATVDRQMQHTRQATARVDAALSIESLIGAGVLGLILLYLIYVFLADTVWPWIRQKRSR